MSLTPTKLAAKRHERTMVSRSKAKAKARRRGLHAELVARNRTKTASWLLDLAKDQEKAQKAADEARRQALESRRTKAAMPGHPPSGAWNRVKAFFRRTP